MKIKELTKRGDLVPSWQSLRNLGNSRLVASSIFFPVVGYYILYGEEFQRYFQLVSHLSQTTENSRLINWILSWSRANLLYLGMVAVSLGTLIYQVFCPAIVKEYASGRAYVSIDTQTRSVYLIKYLIHQIIKFPDHKRKWYQDWISDFSKSYGSIFSAATRHSVKEIHDELKNSNALKEADVRLGSIVDTACNAIMLMHYSISSWSSRHTRMLCALMFGVGFFLITLSSVPIFLKVLLTIFAS